MWLVIKVYVPTAFDTKTRRFGFLSYLAYSAVPISGSGLFSNHLFVVYTVSMTDLEFFFGTFPIMKKKGFKCLCSPNQDIKKNFFSCFVWAPVLSDIFKQYPV